jgi:NitT/TauT family transport system substrate-binding protein
MIDTPLQPLYTRTDVPVRTVAVREEVSMNALQATRWSRREFLGGLTLAGTTGLLGLPYQPVAGEPLPETSRLRLAKVPGVSCFAPQYFAEELLRTEGFVDVQYTTVAPGGSMKAVASGELDIAVQFAGPLIIRVDAGDPVVMLAGGHIGCFELFGTDQIRSIRDLRGKTVAVPTLGSPAHVFVASIASYVGLDPRQDITWVTYPPAESMQLLGEGKIDAFLGFPPQPQELRARKLGHVLVNSAVDRPWSQYFCCMIAGNRGFVQRHPVATKRVLRAILKAANVCALEPDRVARFLVDKGHTTNYEYTFQAVKEIPYGKWREYDPEDTVRFYALRLHEAGMIKSSPQKIIAQGTDWQFLTELKKELKG